VEVAGVPAPDEVAVVTDRPGHQRRLISVPLRWGEPDPLVEIEILTIEGWRERDYGEKG